MRPASARSQRTRRASQPSERQQREDEREPLVSEVETAVDRKVRWRRSASDSRASVVPHASFLTANSVADVHGHESQEQQCRPTRTGVA